MNEGTATISLSTGDGKSPPPDEPEAPEDYPVKRGWKESINEVLEKIKTTLPAAGPVNPVYEPNINGETSPTNDGDGLPPDGWAWTNQVRKKVTKEKIPYTMNYKFSKK